MSGLLSSPRGGEVSFPLPHFTREESAGTAGVGQESALVHRTNDVRAWRDRHHSIFRSLNPHHVADAVASEDAQNVGLVNDGD